jgi:hypothetical protein
MSDEKKDERFGLGWLAAVPMVIYVVAQVTASLPIRDDRQVGQICGRIIGGLLIACLAGWIAFAAGRRSRRAASITFSVVILLMAFAMLPNRQADDVRIKEAATQLVAEMTAARAKYDGVVENFAAAGGIDPQALPSRQAIDERLALLKIVLDEDETMMRVGTGAAARLEVLLREKGVGDRHVARAMDEFNRSYQTERLVAFQRAETGIGQAMNAYLVFLHDHWGRWKLDSSGAVVLDTHDLLAEHERLLKRVDDVEAERDRLRDAIHELREGARGGVAP